MAKPKTDKPTETTPPAERKSKADAPPADTPADDGQQSIRLRSRYPNYRVGDIAFTENRAEVTPAQLEAVRKLPEFGRGLDFWIDDTPSNLAVSAA
ncbi:MAG: hypothetical protein KDA05_12395 [Phycisphaerales bacterium]|nr:hypothetical protein [Phycisphaerales bacterium]